jgi:hypothetical protein
VTDLPRAGIARFADACSADPLVVAAFLGGSFASGTADAFSDLDVYVVTEEPDYGEFFARRERFMRTWGDPAFLDTTVNFGGFGFDMLHFVFRDGVCGELAMGHRNNLLALHGGPHEVLVDKADVLDGVTFPLYEQPEEERVAEVERALAWFWLDVIGLAKALGRGRIAAAMRSLGSMRDRCETIVGADARLIASHTTGDPAAIGRAALGLVELHRDEGRHVAADQQLRYPVELAVVAQAHLQRALDEDVRGR